MLQGAYSVQYSVLRKQDEQFSQDKENLDLNMERSRRMQAETSKRRKALAVKRKQDAEREERRRQEILARRRENIKAATEKYQRLNKNYQPKSDAEIREQLIANQSHASTPALEEALRAVRGSSHYRVAGSATIHGHTAGQHGPVKASHGVVENKYLQSAPAYYHQPYQGAYTPGARRAQSAVHARTHEKPPSPRDTSKHHDLQSNSSRNVTNSRSLFEQQLENQQNQLMQQQKDILDNFSSALHKELDKGSHGNDSGYHNNSSCSIDSLEGGTNTNSAHLVTHSNANTVSQSNVTSNFSVSGPVTSGNAVTFASHRPTNSPVAVVTPSIIRRSASDSSLSSNKANGNVPRPYNKDNYDLKDPNGQAELSQDSLERKTGGTLAGAYIETHGLAPSDSHAGAYHQESVVNTAAIEGPYSKYGPTGSHLQGRHKAWVTPSNDDIRDVAKSHAVQASPLTASSKPIMARPGFENAAVSNGNASSGYFLHTSGAATAKTPAVSEAAMYPATHGYMTQSHALNSRSKSSAQASPAPFSNTHPASPANHTVTSDVHSKPVDNGYTLGSNQATSAYANHYSSASPYSESNPSHTATVAHSQSQSIYDHTPSAVTSYSQAVASSHYNSAYPAAHPYQSQTTTATQPVATSGYDATVYASTHDEVPNTYTSTSGVAPPGHMQWSTGAFSSSSNAYSVTPSRGYENHNATAPSVSSGGTMTSVPSNGYQRPNSTAKATVAPSQHAPTSAYAAYVTTKATPTIGVNAPSNAHVRITIPHPDPRRAVPKIGAAVRTPADDPSKIPRPKNPPINLRQANMPDTDSQPDVPSPESSSDVEEESHPEPPPAQLSKKVKGILKKPSSATYPRRADTMGVRGQARGLQRSMSAHANLSIRDSVDLAREQLSDRSAKKAKIPRKKSVRFWDMAYEEDSAESDAEDAQQEFTPLRSDDPTSVPHKPPRAHSAKVTSSNPRPDPRANRAMSAGSTRRGPFLRPHPPPNPPSGRATMSSNHMARPQPKAADTSPPHGAFAPPPVATSTYSSSAYADRDANGYTISQSDVDKSIEAVYDANGVRLDHTPTDEEINWLWDKVRTCLNRDGSTASSGNGPNGVSKQNPPYPAEPPNQYNNPRHSTQASQGINTKYIDGTVIAPQYRAQQRIGPSSGYGQANGVPRSAGTVKKVSMDTLSNFNRRQALLNQRKKEQGTISYHQPDASATVQTSLRDLNSQKPIPSDAIPSAPTMTSSGPGIYTNNMTESMAAFTTAEQMAGQASVTESQIEQAMHEAQARQAAINASANTRNAAKVPSALSIEEQRLIQSLERLNERLKVNENGVSMRMAFDPQPPGPQYGGFKGRQPIASNHAGKRFATPNGTVPRQPYRVSSATATAYPRNGGYSQHRYK